MNETWNEISNDAQKKVAYQWLQSEGYDDNGNEYDCPEDFYNASRRIKPKQNPDELMIIAGETGALIGAGYIPDPLANSKDILS